MKGIGDRPRRQLYDWLKGLDLTLKAGKGQRYLGLGGSSGNGHQVCERTRHWGFVEMVDVASCGGWEGRG